MALGFAPPSIPTGTGGAPAPLPTKKSRVLLGAVIVLAALVVGLVIVLLTNRSSDSHVAPATTVASAPINTQSGTAVPTLATTAPSPVATLPAANAPASDSTSFEEVMGKDPTPAIATFMNVVASAFTTADIEWVKTHMPEQAYAYLLANIQSGTSIQLSFSDIRASFVSFSNGQATLHVSATTVRSENGGQPRYADLEIRMVVAQVNGELVEISEQ